MEETGIRELKIIRTGQEFVIEHALTAELKQDGESWLIDLMAPRTDFPSDVEDGQLARLQWESDGASWESHARLRVQGEAAGDDQGNLHVLFEGAEAIRPRNLRDGAMERAHLQAKAQEKAARSAAKRT